MQGDQQHIDQLDADKRHDDAAQPVDQQVSPQQRTGADRAIRDASQGKRNERDDDQRVENDGGQDGALTASPVPSCSSAFSAG